MSAEQVAFFRARYTEKETSPTLPENQPKSEFFKTVWLWWSRIKCFYRCFCGSRFRLALTALAMLIVMMLLRDAAGVTKWMFSYKDTAQSSWQSYGLLHEPLWKWQSRKGYFASMHAMDTVVDDAHIPLMDAALWFEKYGKVDFVCPTEQAVVVDAIATTTKTTTTTTTTTNQKWYLCNPQSVAQHHRGCLIYTTGKPDVPHHRLEHALLQALTKPCEIHVFDPFATGNEEVIHVPLNGKKHRQRRNQDDMKEGGEGDEDMLGNETITSGGVRGGGFRTSTITVHPWGLTGAASSNHNLNTTSVSSSSSPPSSQKLSLKTLSETWQVLNHGQRTLDLLVLDCAGCEWDVYTELLEPITSTTTSATTGATKTTIKSTLVHAAIAASVLSKSSPTLVPQSQPQLPALPLHVLMQVHALPSEGSGGISGNDYHSLLLQHMRQQHYVRFHRVPQLWNGQPGHAQAYSFLKLRPGFFN